MENKTVDFLNPPQNSKPTSVLNDYFDFLRESQTGEFDHLPFGFIALSKKGIVKYVNSAASKLLQVEKRHLTDSRFYPYVYGDDLGKIKYKKQSPTSCFPKSEDVRLNRGKTILWTKMNIVYDPYARSAYGPIQLSFCDISHIKSIEQENVELKQQLLQDQKKEASKKEVFREFPNEIANDLNIILNSIVQNIDTVLENTSRYPEIRKTLNDTLISAKRAEDLVKQVLSFSHQTF